MSNDSPNTGSTRRILVVDDQEDALFVLRMLLEIKGYTVQTCLSGQQALLLAESDHPDAILLDISMPGMDGYETCHRLRQQAWGSQVVLIALTGYGQVEDVERSHEAGFNGHLTKPVDLDALMSLLQRGNEG